MGTKSISQLNDLTPVGGMHIPMEDGGNTGKATLDAIVAASSSAIDHETRISSAESSVSDLTSRVGSVETTVSNLSSTAATLTNNVGTNTSDISAIEDDLSDLGTDLTALTTLVNTNLGTHKIISGVIQASTPLTFSATYAVGAFWFNDSNTYLIGFRSGATASFVSNGSTLTFSADETAYTVTHSSTNFNMRYVIIYRP